MRWRHTGAAAFTEKEQAAILEFAGGYPLTLQVACHEVLESRDYEETVKQALERAKDELNALMPRQDWRASQ